MEREDVIKAAELAKLDYSKSDLREFEGVFQRIISLVEEFQTIDTEGVKPTFHGNDVMNVYREDVAVENPNYQDLLDNAPTVQDTFIQVPAIMETEED